MLMAPTFLLVWHRDGWGLLLAWAGVAGFVIALLIRRPGLLLPASVLATVAGVVVVGLQDHVTYSYAVPAACLLLAADLGYRSRGLAERNPAGPEAAAGSLLWLLLMAVAGLLLALGTGVLSRAGLPSQLVATAFGAFALASIGASVVIFVRRSSVA